tara:strand:- start:2688 stop:2993 length:306 start_codon:yes stop_codon:yes gene_type:complete
MNQRIIYPTQDGSIAVIIPTSEIEIFEVARKDVPNGKPYKIVDVSDIPTDRTFRDAWEADFNNPDGVGIGAEAWFAEQAAIKEAEELAQQQAQVEVENDNN